MAAPLMTFAKAWDTMLNLHSDRAAFALAAFWGLVAIATLLRIDLGDWLLIAMHLTGVDR